MRTEIPGEPIFVAAHGGEPPPLFDVALSPLVTYNGFQMDLRDQKLIALCINFLKFMEYIADVSITRGTAFPATVISTSLSRLARYLGEGEDALENISDSLGRVLMARLRIERDNWVVNTTLIESFTIFKATKDVKISINLTAVEYYREHLAGLMQVKI